MFNKNKFHKRIGGSFDFVNLLNKTNIGLPFAKYKGEIHLPGYNFAGPGTQLQYRLDDNDNPLPDSIPINKIDEIAYKHDIFYRDHNDLNDRHNADITMINELKQIQNPSFKHKLIIMLIIKSII